MKTHTSEFKTNIASLGKQLDSIVTFTINGTTTTLGVDELNSVTPHYEGAILKSVMKQLDIDSNVEIPIGTQLNYKFGVLVGDNYEYLDFGDYIVKSSEYSEDNESYTVECYDLLLNSMVEYSKLNIVYPITIKDFLKAICNRIGVAFKDSDFVNATKLIYSEKFLYEDGSSLGFTYRDVLDQLAQITGSTICISKDNQVEVRYITETNDTINEDYFSSTNVDFGTKYGPVNSLVFSRSEDTDNIYLNDEDSISTNGLCEIKISDNELLNDDNRVYYIEDLFNSLKGLEYYSNDYSSPGIAYYDLCDRYTVSVNDNTYSCIMLNDELNVTQGLDETVYTEIPEQAETDYTSSGKEDSKVRRTSFIVNKQSGEIDALVSDYSDLTGTNHSYNANLEYKNVISGEPVYMEIHPLQESISYLYPSTGLFPQEELYPKQRLLRFTNVTTNEVFDYEFPDDLLYFDNENYDTFILDSDKELCYIDYKCYMTDEEEVKVLDTPTTKYYDYPTFNLTSGDYKIEIVGYDNGYIKATMLASGTLSNVYATKTELKITDDKASITSEKVGYIEENLETSKDVTGNEIEINDAGNYNLTKFKKYGKCVKEDNVITVTSAPYDVTFKHSDTESTTTTIELPIPNLYEVAEPMSGLGFAMNQTTYKYEFVEDDLYYTYMEIEPNTVYTISRKYISEISYDALSVSICDEIPTVGGKCTGIAKYARGDATFVNTTYKYMFISYASTRDTEEEEEEIRNNLRVNEDYNGLTNYELASVETDTLSAKDRYDGVTGILYKYVGLIDNYKKKYADEISLGYICDTDELEEGSKVYYILKEPYQVQFDVPKLVTYAGYNKITDNDVNNTDMEITYQTSSTLNKEYTSKAEFSVMSNEIDSKVSQDDIIADLNVAIKNGKGVITLTGDEVVIDSDNFSVDGTGKITATSGEIGGFNLGATEFNTSVSGIYNYNRYDASIVSAMLTDLLYKSTSMVNALDANSDGKLLSNDSIVIGKILDGTLENTHNVSCKFNINSNDPKNCVSITNDTDTLLSLGAGGVNANMVSTENLVVSTNTNPQTVSGIFANGDDNSLIITDGDNQTHITNTLIEVNEIDATTVKYTNLVPTSQEEKKKNFEKFNNGLDLINSTEIYKYNYKDEEDTDKKHIGFIIGKNYKYSQEITNKDNTGVDLYSFISVCCKAIQEQQKEIEELKEEIKSLKESE